MRISHCLFLAAGLGAVLAQPALADAHASHRARHVAHAYGRVSAATAQQLANPIFYGPFGGYPEAAAAAQYSGPGERHYFGAGNGYSYFGAGNGYSYFNAGGDQRAALQGLVEQHASANGLPPSLVHRVIMRESRYNPRAVNAGNYGLMQIRLATARSMGYSGSAAGLLDAETNMTYAVKYLAGAYRAAHGNENLAVALYSRGYYGRD
jgi:soluble lytic murein transglycosylase-like protein